MEVISSIQKMQELAIRVEKEGKKIGFVPTMGYLHEGHLSLVELLKNRSDLIILSIFVNPIQFGLGEDLEKYPRSPDRDLKLCKDHGVDYVFFPHKDELYKEDASTFVSEETASKFLCGQARPTHFRGVTTICAKLFNLCRPAHLAVGQKDAQQVVVLKRMIRDMHFPIEVVVGKTIRDHDGLAMSSRNEYLNAKQRKDALLLNRALEAGRKLVDQKGIRNVDRVKAELMAVMRNGQFLRINYAEVVDRETMFPENEIKPGRSMLVVAAWVDSVRLIDNMMLDEKKS